MSHCWILSSGGSYSFYAIHSSLQHRHVIQYYIPQPSPEGCHRQPKTIWKGAIIKAAHPMHQYAFMFLW